MAINRLSETSFKINLGFIGIDTTWQVDESQKNAAWEMYVELSTRITVAELKEDEGSLREALNSLHSFFGTTRELLKKYGPIIATPLNPDDTTLGHLAVNILNRVIRPVLAKWHPELMDWEQKKPIERTVIEHEKEWEKNKDFRRELNSIRLQLIEYANVLGEVSGVANLIEDYQ